jgi:hypothetical protein
MIYKSAGYQWNLFPSPHLKRFIGEFHRVCNPLMGCPPESESEEEQRHIIFPERTKNVASIQALRRRQNRDSMSHEK